MKKNTLPLELDPFLAVELMFIFTLFVHLLTLIFHIADDTGKLQINLTFVVI